jgi:hypothetical protein
MAKFTPEEMPDPAAHRHEDPSVCRQAFTLVYLLHRILNTERIDPVMDSQLKL